MEAVNILLRKKFSSWVSGLQLQEKVPLLLSTEDRWHIETPMNPVESPACQIHHTHKDHWVTSVYHENKVYLLDSLGNERSNDNIIPDGLKIQLSVLYSLNSDKLNRIIPDIMKQSNSYDCGLFAIAFATTYCFRKIFALI